MYKIEDEHGAVWHVGKGDPAYEYVQKLHKSYYSWVVLPRETILDGTLPEVPAPNTTESDYLVLKRAMRLTECLEALRD